MKNYYNIKLLLLVCLVVSFGFLSSCDKEDNNAPNNGQVELLSFGPTGAKHGQKVKFIGHNLDKVESIELPGVTIAKAQFTSQSADLIEVVVPTTATSGKVVLKLAGGESYTTKTALNFEVPVTITAMTAQAKPGTNITLTGNFLTWVESVQFGDDPTDTVQTFVSQTMTELVVTVPMDAKTSKITVFTGGTEPLAIVSETELQVSLPAATALAPNTISNGADLTITGTDLDLVKEVIFTGVGAAKVATFVRQSATELVVKVPANAAKGKLKLVALSGVEVPTTQELTLVLPAATALAPAAVKHDENLTITGTNLDLVKEVKFTGVGDAKVATFVRQSATELVVKVPKNASKGTLKLVAKSGVEVTTQELAIVLPAIATLAPAPVDPGKELTINGTNLDLVKSIEFQGGTKVSAFVSQTPSRIVVIVPMDAKKGALKLTTVFDYAVATDALVTIILPAITAVSPEPVVAGTYLTLSGTDLNLVKSVVFSGDVTVSAFVAQTNTQIVLVVPATAKTGALKLITQSGFEVATGKQAQVGSAAPNIAYYIFNDALTDNTQTGDKWDLWGGWGTETQDLANTENPSRGAKAIKIVYKDAYGALQLHPAKANVLAGYSHIVLYVRGGDADSRIAIAAKTTTGAGTSEPTIDVKAGEYKLVEIPISALGDVSAGITEFYIKNYGTMVNNTIYIDDLGLR
jgi:hypothetical protein